MKNTLILLLALFTLSTTAQDTTSAQKFFQDSLKTTISEVIVTGVRPDVKTPITQKTITSEDISKSYQGQEMSYIIDKTPSVVSQTDGGNPNGYTYFRIRGIDMTRINMTLDGVPLNEPEDQGVYFSNYPDFATYLNSMQIQRGVGTSSNGTAAYGGSINFESKNGIQKEMTAQLGYGSFNTKRANVTYGSGLHNKFAVFAGASAYESDGYKYNAFGQGYSGFLSVGYYNTKDIIKFTGFTGRALNGMAWLPVSEIDILNDPRTNYNPKGEEDDFTQSFAQLKHIHSFNNKSAITSTVYYNSLIGTWGMFTSPFDLFQFNLKSNFYGVMSNYRLELDKLTLNVGIHANTYDRTHGGTTISTFYTRPEYTNTGYKKEVSAYTKVSYNINKFTIFGDAQVRNTSFSYIGDVNMDKLNWLFFNPKGGITFNKSNTTNYYFSVGQNHREPTRSDMFGGYDNLFALNTVTPEQVLDYELGSNIKTTRFSVQYNIYYMNFKNQFVLLGEIGTNSLALMTNVDQSYRSGAEIDFTERINKLFTSYFSMNYSYSRIMYNGSERTPLYTPNFIINKGLEYTHKGVSMSIEAKYHTKSYINLDNTATTPEFITFNSNIGYKYKHYSIAFQAINLLNTRYYTAGSSTGIGSNYYYVNAPLSVYITMKYEL